MKKYLAYTYLVALAVGGNYFLYKSENEFALFFIGAEIGLFIVASICLAIGTIIDSTK
jgi:hypothetical protein